MSDELTPCTRSDPSQDCPPCPWCGAVADCWATAISDLTPHYIRWACGSQETGQKQKQSEACLIRVKDARMAALKSAAREVLRVWNATDWASHVRDPGEPAAVLARLQAVLDAKGKVPCAMK